MQALLVAPASAYTNHVRRLLARNGIAVREVGDLEDVPLYAEGGGFHFAVLVAPQHVTTMAAVVRSIRQAGTDLPLLVVVTSRGFDIAATLRAGADDVIWCEADDQEFVARCQTVAWRRGGRSNDTANIASVGALKLDLDAREVTVHGRSVSLSSREFAVIEILAKKKSEVVSKEAIMSALYRTQAETINQKIVDVFVYHIRRKLEQAGASIEIATLRGRGYRLREATSSADLQHLVGAKVGRGEDVSAVSNSMQHIDAPNPPLNTAGNSKLAALMV